MLSCVSYFYGNAFQFVVISVLIAITGSTVLKLGAASDPWQLQLKEEANAVLASGWWNTSYYNGYDNISGGCMWDGIVCNGKGSITEIAFGFYIGQIQFATLNLSAFHNLKRLDLSEIRLDGSIPSEIGNLPQLTFLDLSFNFLQGEIPLSLGNLIKLKSMSISNNCIQGSIPPELRFLKNLIALDLSHNMIHTTFPISLTNLTHLEVLDLSNNKLVGSLPSKLDQLANLRELRLNNNSISGTLPISLTNLTHLKILDISDNILVGSLPSNLDRLTGLQELQLKNNYIGGTFSMSLTNLTYLEKLDISYNLLVGSLPFNLGRLISLGELQLKNNYIGGILPISLAKLVLLKKLDISHNLLIGSIPSNLNQLTMLQELRLNNNTITGNIPLLTVSLAQLITCDLSHNLICGEIPYQLGSLPSLKFLNLSYNNLTGMVSRDLLYATYVNVSYNNLKGPIPDGFPQDALIGNRDVFGHNSHFEFQLQPHISPSKTCNKAKHCPTIILSIIIFLIVAFMLLGCLKLHSNARKNKHLASTTTKNGDLFSIWNYDGSIAYEDIVRVTEDFDMKYCIGTGAYGSVYKAQLPSGKVVALKKLHGFEAEVPALDESFRNEAKVLSEIKHRHIVKLYGFCLHKRIMFLIYQHMEKGSLFSVLYDDAEAMQLDWRKRVNIVKGIAHALSYLHHDCTPPIVHRDISTSNILLNSECEPSVSDFGIARLLNHDSSNRTIVAGTIE